MTNMHRASRDQEDRWAADIEGSRNSGSGSGLYRKNDVRNVAESWELKITSKRSYTLKLDELLKAERHALLDNGRSMRFGITMGGRDVVVLFKEDYDTLQAAVS